MLKLFGKNIPTRFEIQITQYGTGGSYSLPNRIISNIRSQQGVKPIFHEMMHLMIEPWIQKYQILHWEKERTVDLLLHSKEFSFLECDWWQKNGQETGKYLDPLFKEKFFESPEEYFKQIKSHRI